MEPPAYETQVREGSFLAEIPYEISRMTIVRYRTGCQEQRGVSWLHCDAWVGRIWFSADF